MHTTSNFVDSFDENISENSNVDVYSDNDSKIISIENNAKEDTKNESSSAIWNLINNFSRSLFPKNKSKEKDVEEIDEENVNNIKYNENIKFIDSPFPEELESDEYMANSHHPILTSDIHQYSLHSSKRHNKILRSSSDSMNSYDSDSSEESLSDIHHQPLHMHFYSRESLNPILSSHDAINTTLPPLSGGKPNVTPIPIFPTNEFEHHHKQMAETSLIPSSSVLAMQFDHTLTLSPSNENLYDHGRELCTDPIKDTDPIAFDDFDALDEKPVDGLLTAIREEEKYNESNIFDINDFDESSRINNYSTVSKDLYDKYSNSKANIIREKKLVNGDLIDPQNNIEVITNGIPIATLHATTTNRKVIENELIKEVIDGNLTEDLNNNKKLSSSPFSIHSIQSNRSNRSINNNNSPKILSSSPEGTPSLSSRKSNNSINSIKKKDLTGGADDYSISEIVNHPIQYEKRSSSESTHSTLNKRNNKLCSKCKNDIRCLSPSIGVTPICTCRNDIRHISPKLSSSIATPSPKLSSEGIILNPSQLTDVALHSPAKELSDNHAFFNKNTNVYNAMNETSLDDIKFCKNTNVFNALASPITTIPLDKVREMKEVISKKVPVEIHDDNRVIAHQIANPTAPIKTIKIMSKNQTVVNEDHLDDEFCNTSGNPNSPVPITNRLSSSPDNSASTLNLANVDTVPLTHSPQNDSVFNPINTTTCTTLPPLVNNITNDNKDKYTPDESFSSPSLLNNSIAIERPSDHEQLVKPAIDTDFLMTSKAKATPVAETSEEYVILTDPTSLLLNDTSAVSPPPPPKPVPALSMIEKPYHHHHHRHTSSSNSKKAHTVDSPLNISTTKDNKVSSHYLNQNEKFIGIFNYIELPPTTKHKSKKKSVAVDQASTSEDSPLKNNQLHVSTVTFDLHDDDDEEKHSGVEAEEENSNSKSKSKPLSSEEISKEIDKEYQKIQAQIKDDLKQGEVDENNHDDLESEISILSPYSPNNINILDQEVSLESAIPIRSAVVTECSQSPLSTSEDKHKAIRARARSRAHSLNYLRNRSFSGKLGLGSFGLGLANLTNLTENGELAITEDNVYLYNLENDTSLDALSTVSSNLSINLK
ncbi:hypothetical protein PIROE2DRAFT_58938 [Piromyces sp. E2]|nr:hypothetical protein PIROE2DRAFT_58938 [Piromyces sp. E2]|eukprot:OUM67106.1 hypothetical protein PIROE2DRAFT_58938 [Piromyces sp. E2]